MAYVFDTASFRHYRFPTHTNDLVVDRSQTTVSEVFIVVLEYGEAPPPHKHDDTEQVFYILEGEGTLTIGEEQQTFQVKPGNVVLIPPSTMHYIVAQNGKSMRYLAVDCFLAERHVDEPTWDDHVKTMCRENGWDYDAVTSSLA